MRFEVEPSYRLLSAWGSVVSWTGATVAGFSVGRAASLNLLRDRQLPSRYRDGVPDGFGYRRGFGCAGNAG
jgi:hypothetical protein